MNSILSLDTASAAAPAAFFLNASTALGFSPPCPAGAWSGITRQIRNRMKTQPRPSQPCCKRKPTPDDLGLPDCNTGQVAQAVLALAGDA